MRRSRFLKYSCILMLLTAFVRIAFGIMMINFYSTAATFGAVEKGTLRTAGLTLFLVLSCGAAELACGFVGALNWEEPLHAPKCFAWGLAALLLGLAGNAMQAVLGYGISEVAWFTGCIAPLVYFAASLRFLLGQRRAGKERQNEQN